MAGKWKSWKDLRRFFYSVSWWQFMVDGTKPLPEPLLTNHQWGLVAFVWGKFHGKCSTYLMVIRFRKLVIEDHSHIPQKPMGKTRHVSWSTARLSSLPRTYKIFDVIRADGSPPGHVILDDVERRLCVNPCLDVIPPWTKRNWKQTNKTPQIRQKTNKQNKTKTYFDWSLKWMFVLRLAKLRNT